MASIRGAHNKHPLYYTRLDYDDKQGKYHVFNMDKTRRTPYTFHIDDVQTTTDENDPNEPDIFQSGVQSSSDESTFDEEPIEITVLISNTSHILQLLGADPILQVFNDDPYYSEFYQQFVSSILLNRRHTALETLYPIHPKPGDVDSQCPQNARNLDAMTRSWDCHKTVNCLNTRFAVYQEYNKLIEALNHYGKYLKVAMEKFRKKYKQHDTKKNIIDKYLCFRYEKVLKEHLIRLMAIQQQHIYPMKLLCERAIICGDTNYRNNLAYLESESVDYINKIKVLNKELNEITEKLQKFIDKRRGK